MTPLPYVYYAHYCLEQYPSLHSRYCIRGMKSAPPPPRRRALYAKMQDKLISKKILQIFTSIPCRFSLEIEKHSPHMIREIINLRVVKDGHI